ncbi:unnamed protein product [Ectocarpus sp. 8 AP-2014]
MFVVKRSGVKEDIRFDKVTSRIEKLCYGLNRQFVDPVAVTLKVNQGIYSGVTTSELDELAALTCAHMATTHPDYSTLAARICLSNLDKQTDADYLHLVTKLRDHVHPDTGEDAPMVTEELVNVVKNHKDLIQQALDAEVPMYDFFGFKTLEKSYLLRMKGKVVERPLQLLMRVSIGIHGHDINSAIQMFQMTARKKYTMATPTLFNAGTPHAQMSSCFLLHMKSDSVEGIFDTLKDCAHVSKHAGGIGVSIHDIRSSGSYIRGTGGMSSGIVPMLRMFNDCSRFIDQAGRRKGSFAFYLEPWHADIRAFLDMKRNTGNDLERARDLFFALWVPDLFMQRVENNGKWSLFSPNEATGLADFYGEEFNTLYVKYEQEGKARETIDARQLWNHMLDVQVETGTPYVLFKDAANRTSNHKHLGTIKSSNLCAEIIQYTSPMETAVCNLASVSLPAMVKEPYTEGAFFDFDELKDIAGQVVRNLNRVIDSNFYPIPEARLSNMTHRPVGMGVQGLADTFARMRLPYASAEACELNKKIFETMYYGAMVATVALAKRDGPYESFAGSPLSSGKFHFDLHHASRPVMYDWDSLRADVVKFGARNSLLIALPPTASTASILGNNESFEAFTSNVYNRRVLSGEFPIINHHLLRELTALGLWDDEVKQQLLLSQGSVQAVNKIPSHLKEIYKTVWEIPQRVVIEQAADRAPFVCQSQSMNMFVESPSRGKLTSMLFHSWKRKLVTGMYYLRSRPKSEPVQFGVSCGRESQSCEACSA